MEQKTPQSGGSERVHPQTVKRAGFVLLAFVALFFGLLVRILLLQTVSYEHYQQKVLEQLTTESSVNASRGNIYDRNGVVLATNVSTYRVFISPSSIASAQSEHDVTGTVLALFVGEYVAHAVNANLGKGGSLFDDKIKGAVTADRLHPRRLLSDRDEEAIYHHRSRNGGDMRHDSVQRGTNRHAGRDEP